MSIVLSVKNLKKSYGHSEAVKDISFDVAENEIFALIGPNGAGKSTTLKIISTLLSPTLGSVEVASYDLVKSPEKIREVISYLPEEAGAYKNLKGIQYLKFMAAIYSDDAKKQTKYVKKGLEIFGLANRVTDKIITMKLNFGKKKIAQS